MNEHRPVFRLFIFLCLFHALPPRAAGTEIVPYVWGGLLQEGTGVNKFHASVRFLLDRGFHSIRFAATPNAVMSYELDTQLCPEGQQTLRCMLGELLGNPIFDDPRLQSLYITLQATVDEDREETDADLLRKDASAIEADYAQAFDYLATRFHRRPIPITILNWEGDNKVYCGSLEKFTKHPEARAACIASGDPGRRLDGFLAWMRMRLRVVAEARQRHPDLDVRVGPEINGLHAMEGCKPDRNACAHYSLLVSRIQEIGHVGLCSYSAYSSLNRGSLGTDLPLLLQKCDKVILGEVGFKYHGENGPDVEEKFLEFQDAIQPYLNRIPAIIYWNAFEPDTGSEPGYGLFTPDGAPKNIQLLPPALRPASDILQH